MLSKQKHLSDYTLKMIHFWKQNMLFFLQMRISEILNQTQYFFDHLASDSVLMDKIGNSVARDKFFEGLKTLGVIDAVFWMVHFA